MDLINSKDQRYKALVADLIFDLYVDYPLLAKKKILDLEMANSHKNPFLKFGQIENFLLVDEGRAIAHASAIIDTRLEKSVAIVGYFETVNDNKYAFKVLDGVVAFLKSKSKNIIRGPVNLNTWNNFRFSYPDAKGPFFTEPFSKEYYVAMFESFGFELAQKNFSSLASLNSTKFASFEDSFDKFVEQAYEFEWINQANFDCSIDNIYGIILETFADSWNFIKISLEEFKYFNQGFKTLDNNFSCVIKDKQANIVAFCFAVRDIYNIDKKNIVIKTFAINKEHQGRGLAKALFYFLYKKAQEDKVDNFIFSTMRDDNSAILNLTDGGELFRYYKVYQLIV